jgi:Caspase domain
VKYAADKVNLATILDSKAPPEITIVSPGEKSEVGSDGVTVVEAKFAHRHTDNNGGVGRVEWRVNSVTRAVEDLQLPAGVREKTIARQLALPPGDNVIELVAYNKANLAAALPAAVSVTVKSATLRPQPKLYVLAVGVDKYPKPRIEELNYSVADAKSVLAAFELFKSDKKTYADVVTHGLFDELVTAQNVQAEFKRLGTIIRPDDVFVLYLAGHGVTIDGRFYFVPHNAKGTLADLTVESAIGQNQLQDWLTEVPAFRSVLIYDSCESGSATEDRSGFRGLQQLVAAEKLSRSMGRTVLSATTDVASALEGYEKHGIFTYVLLDAFARADRDNDGQITTEELAEYLRAMLPALTEDLAKKYPDLKLSRQEPQVKLSGAPFALVPRADISDINRVR